MAWILVPLQYLYLIWRAESLIAQAAKAAGTRKHAALLKKASAATLAAEKMQRRFPEVTTVIDIRRNDESARFDLR